MIVEGLVTTLDREGRLNIAPMGPIVIGEFASLVLRPFQPSTTFSNLETIRCGVFHVVDRVDVIAAAAIGQLKVVLATQPAAVINGQVLKDCCRWFEFTIDSIDSSESRSRMPATIVHAGERRPFFGFNRARHAVLEIAILATRLHLLPATEIDSAVQLLTPAVHKTGGPEELNALELLLDYIRTERESGR
jgi:hypothetical protein